MAKTKTKEAIARGRAPLEQPSLFRWGGSRKRAGRRPAQPRPKVGHDARSKTRKHHPVLVTARLLPGLPSLRCSRTFATLEKALLAGSDRFGFRLIEFSVQSNHIHALVEAEDNRALSRGMQGLLVRVAKALNREWGRRGKVLADRFDGRVLRSLREIRTVLVYVLQNAKKHGSQFVGPDEFSSGRWFQGWMDAVAIATSPLPAARSWRLVTGWLRYGRIRTSEGPAPRRGTRCRDRGRADGPIGPSRTPSRSDPARPKARVVVRTGSAVDASRRPSRSRSERAGQGAQRACDGA